MYSAVLLSGGKGKRMMKGVPKQYLLLAGKPIIMHSIERLDSLSQVNQIVIVCEEEYVTAIRLMLKQYNIDKDIVFAEAGTTRQESVYSGLQKVNNERVIIHEAARPFATVGDYQRLINAESPNAMLGYPIPYTVVKGNAYITDILERQELMNVQLPQKFDVSIIKSVHEKALIEEKTFTEDASMVYFYTNVPVEIVLGTSYNLKITEPIDLLTGEIIYREFIVGRK